MPRPRDLTPGLRRALLLAAVLATRAPAGEAPPKKLDATVSWVGNSFPGANDKWVQNFFVHMNVAPDGTCHTWSHWDEGGNPIYRADRITVLDPPKAVKQVARVWYDVDSDTLVAAEEGRDMRHIGRVSIAKGYLAGNRDAVSFSPAAGEHAGCMAASGEYVFTGGWGQRARIGVHRMSDGAEVGFFDPGPTVGGVEATGWIDILTGITAFRRSDGEYLVFVEEDFRGKAVLYRWRP